MPVTIASSLQHNSGHAYDKFAKLYHLIYKEIVNNEREDDDL